MEGRRKWREKTEESQLLIDFEGVEKMEENKDMNGVGWGREGADREATRGKRGREDGVESDGSRAAR